MRTIDLGNNESKGIGLSGPHTNQAIPFLALTLSESKWFRTRAGAVRWLARRGYDDKGERIREGSLRSDVGSDVTNETMRVLLQVDGIHPLAVRVASEAEASRVVTDWQDRQGYGASDMGAEHGRVMVGRRIVARVAYNGRILKP